MFDALSKFKGAGRRVAAAESGPQARSKHRHKASETATAWEMRQFLVGKRVSAVARGAIFLYNSIRFKKSLRAIFLKKLCFFEQKCNFRYFFAPKKFQSLGLGS